MNRVLVVDDEKNIRLTLAQALESLNVEVDTAADGQEALDKVRQAKYSVILLDLRMSGMDGMTALKHLRDERPEIPVIVITAHGTIDLAVDAMRFGAIEFLQKPFVPADIRSLVQRVLKRMTLHETEADDYATCFELAKRCLSERHIDAAIKHLRRAISIDPERPEAFNCMGAIHELRGETYEALNNYRVAWNFDGTYKAASNNLERATSMHPRSKPIEFGELREPRVESG